jgi:hypothetical protein
MLLSVSAVDDARMRATSTAVICVAAEKAAWSRAQANVEIA